MTAFFVLFSRREKGYRLKAGLLSLATLAAFFGVRLAVLHGGMSYLQVSGVPPDFIRSNWADSTWPPLFLLTACAFLPLLALGWKETPLLLKRRYFFCCLYCSYPAWLLAGFMRHGISCLWYWSLRYL